MRLCAAEPSGGSPEASGSIDPREQAELARQWWDVIIGPEYLAAELAAFPEAWRGAIDLQRESRGDLAAGAYTFEEVETFLSRFRYPVFQRVLGGNYAGIALMIGMLRQSELHE